MATGDSSIVTTQPKSRRREIEEFVRDLDPLQVAGQFIELKQKPRDIIANA